MGTVVRRRAAATAEIEIPGEAAGSVGPVFAGCERAILRSLAPPDHVPDRQRRRKSHRFWSTRDGRRHAQVPEFARDSHLYQEQRAVPSGSREAGTAKERFWRSRRRL